MVIKRPVTLTFAALASIGLALIAGSFFFILPADQRTPVAWLDLVVCGTIFLANFATLPIARPEIGRFSQQIPRLGVLWTTHVSYTSFALAGIWYGWRFGFSFRLQLLYHIALFFGLLVVTSVAGKAAEHAGHVADSERRLNNSLDTVKKAVLDCHATLIRLGDGWEREHSQLQRIKEDIRFLSPCDTVSAVSLDLELARLLEELSAALTTCGQPGRRNLDVEEKLTRCHALTRLRKQERFNATGA